VNSILTATVEGALSLRHRDSKETLIWFQNLKEGVVEADWHDKENTKWTGRRETTATALYWYKKKTMQ
jgi:hypothetical protein